MRKNKRIGEELEISGYEVDKTDMPFLKVYNKSIAVKDNLAKDPSELWIDIFPFDNVPDRGTRSYCQCVRLMQKLYQKNLEANGFYALEATRKKGIYNYLNKICLLYTSDLNRIYLEQGELNVELLGQGFTWLDTGTHESLVDATNFVKTMEQHQHRKIACLEEIAYLNGWITREEVLEIYEVLKKNQYGQYLKDVLDGKYIDAIGENR